MLIGVTIPNVGALAQSDAVVRLAISAEQAGFDSVWVADHLIIPTDPAQAYPYAREAGVALPPDWPFLEPLIALAAVASRTERVLLGTGVYLLPLRHPLVTAKAAASLDVLSGGRLLFGVGLGWISEEYAATGVSWTERGAIMDEQIDLLRALWRESRPSFEGTHFRMSGFGFEPKPVKGDVPIYVGGNNAPARRRAARAGDGWHVIDLEPAEIAERARVFAEDCKAAGRSDTPEISMYASIAIAGGDVPGNEQSFPLMGTAGQIADKLTRYREAGLGHIVLAARGLSTVAEYEALFETIAMRILPQAGLR